MSQIIIHTSIIFFLINFKVLLGVPDPQVWDVDRLIRARNPDAVFSTTERSTTTWQTLRAITYNPKFEKGSVGSASVEEASLVRRIRPTQSSLESGQPKPASSTCLLILAASVCLTMAAQVRWTLLQG